MADNADLSDIGTKDPTQRSMANAYDLSDLGPKIQGGSWKDKPVDVKAVDLSDLGTKEQEPKSYSVENGQVHFAIERPATALAQAVADGVIDGDYAEKHRDDFLRAQVKYQDFQQAAGNGQVAKAVLHGAGRGASFLAGAIPGGKLGATVGVAVAGGPEDPLAAITGPVGAGIGSLTTGTIAAMAYGKAVDKLADYNDFVKSFAASAELHPVANAAGELVAFAASAPKSIAKLVELGRVDLGDAGISATRALTRSPAVAAQVVKGAAAGAAFEGVLRPGFDITRHLIADQMGIDHDKIAPPSVSSLAQNIALGILTAGHSVEFRDFPAGDIVNLEMRAKAREAAGIPLNDDNPAGVIQGFQSLGADPSADLERTGLLRPLTPEEISVHASIQNKVAQLRESGQLDTQEIEALSARQASIPGGRSRIPISRASITLRDRTAKGEPNAVNPVLQQAGVPAEPGGTQQEREANQGAEPGDSLPSATGQPPETQGVAPAVPSPSVSPKVASPQWQVTVQPDQFDTEKNQVVPGWVQIDSVDNGVNQWSSGPEKLKAQGYNIPDFSKLPAGRYTFGDAMQMLANPEAAPKPTKRVGVKISPTGDIPQEPTQAQKEAGNYKMDHIKVHGLDISIENRAGSTRSGVDKGGKPWSVTMKRDYGYIKGTVGRDKDHLDVYLGPDLNSDTVFVIDQVNPETGKFDEHKVMLGYRGDQAGLARMDYAAHFSDGKGNARVGGMTGISMADFKEWIKNGQFTEPLAHNKTLPPVPETPDTIHQQVKMLKEGKRKAVLITPGEKIPDSAKGYPKTETTMGTVIYNPQETNYFQIIEAVKNNTIGEILGYGIPAKPAPGTEVGAVVVRTPAGVEKQGVLTDAEHLPAVKAAAEAVASPGDTINIESEAKVIEKRQRGASVRPGKSASKKELKEVGQNSNGLTVSEDANGVRSYVENGVRVTEPVALVPTRAGILARPSEPRSDEFKTVDEISGSPTLASDANEPAKGASSGVSPGGSSASDVGVAGGERATAVPPAGSAPGVQPAIRSDDEGKTAVGGGGDSRIADADANGIPAEPKPEAPVVPSADTGVETSPEFRGEPSETNPAPDVEVGGAVGPSNIRLTENPAPTGAVARIKANIEALALVKRLQVEGRFPTEEERKVLAQWSGWGSFKEMFNDARAEKRTWDPGWMKRFGGYYDKLKKIFTDSEWNAAIESTVNAHYTSQEVVDSMWNLVRRLGFRGGKALEPATGSGVFVGYIPNDLASKTRWTGVEMEPITGQIFKYLYPEVDMRVEPFQNAKLPNGYFDLVITNVPFHETGPGSEYPTLNLHNYFIARSLDKVRPGGLVVVISTNATMDSDGNGRKEQRALLVDKSQLIGAIRLPNNAFKDSAGTEVVTDIIVLRKPDAKPFEAAQEWRHTSEVETAQGMAKVNQYFAAHPDMVIGKNTMTGTMYRKDSYTVESTPGKLSEKLEEAVKKFPEDVMQSKPETIEPTQTNLEEGTLSIDDKGRVLEARNFLLQTPMSWDANSPARVKRAKLYIHLRDVLKQQYAMEDEPNASEAEIEANRARLNRAYQALQRELQGTVNENDGKMSYLSTDPDFYTVMGVEVFRQRPDPKNPDNTITVVEPADVLSKRVKSPDRPPTSAENASDAVGVSMAYRGHFDLDYVKELTGMSEDAIEAELIAKDMAFRDPDKATLEISQDYLSGDVRDKLAKAIFAAKESPQFMRNVEALKKAIPQTIPFGRIKLSLGTRWVPAQVFNTFASEVIGLEGTEIIFIQGTEEFAVRPTGRAVSAKSKTEWQTEDMTVYDLLRSVLNFKRAKIMRSVREPNDKGQMRDVQREDVNASALANQVIDRMQSEFQSWVRSTPAKVPYRYFEVDRGEYVDAQMPVWDVLEREFNRTKNSVVEPPNDGSMLKLPGLSNQVLRKQHLLNGVMRGITMGSTVYAHGVGSGKTFLEIVLSHEMKRIGLMKKDVIAVKKPTVDQFRVSIERAYPGSRVLMPSEKDFKPANRKKLTARIASSKWDFIILTHEQLKAIRPSEKAVNDFYEDQVQQLRDILRELGAEKEENAKSTRGLSPEVKNIVKKIKSLKKKLTAHMEAIKKRQDIGIEWEKLGIDGLIVDESHNFKKMPLATQMGDGIRGIPSDFSQRAVDLLIKCRDVQRRTSGRNIFFASGTPVSNTLAELWVMFNATNPQLLKQFGIATFDSFATAYADVVTNFEIGWDGFGHDVTRMSRFKNPQSLSLLTRLGMDVKIGNKELGLDVPELEGGKPILRIIKPTPAFDQWIQFLRKIVTEWNGLDKKGRFEYSWIPIGTMRAGVSAALDPRCAFAGAQDHPESKVNTAIKDIFAEWTQGKARKTTMMVFADMYRTMSTEKLARFAGGIPARPDIEEVEIPDEPAESAGEDEIDTSTKDENDYEKNCIGDFNLYRDMREKLVKLGIPHQEIAIIGEHDTDVKRALLFNNVRAGNVRILFGSTEKIGEGVDVAARMSAAFNLDPPMQMTPAKQEQRNGRLIRQGNLHSPKNWNLPVRLYYYAQERSMDAAIYQMLTTKGVMVLQALKGQILGDEFDDPAGELIATMAEMMASSTGDTRVLELAKLQKEVRDLALEEGAFQRRVSELRRSVDEQERIVDSGRNDAQRMVVLGNAVEAEIKDMNAVVLTHKDKRFVGEKAIDEFLATVHKAMEEAIMKDLNAIKQMHFKVGTTINVRLEAIARQYDPKTPPLKYYEAVSYIGPELTFTCPRWDSDLNSPESLLNALKGIPRHANKRAMDSTKKADDAVKLGVAYAEQFKNLKFEKGEALAERRSRLNDLESELRDEGIAAAAKAEQDVKERKAANSAVPVPVAEEAEIPHDDEIPVEDRLKAQIDQNLPVANKLRENMVRAMGRFNLLPVGSDERAMAIEDWHSENDELTLVESRIVDLGRRLAVVMKHKYPDKPIDLPLSNRRAAMSIAPTPTSEGEEIVVRGLQELAMLLRDGRSGLSAEARRVAVELLNTPVMQNLDWSNLTVSLKNRIEDGYSGSADVAMNLIEMAKATTPTTFPHEIFHFLWHMLTPEDKAHIEHARMEALHAELVSFKESGAGGLPPDAIALFQQLMSGKMSSDAYLQQYNRLAVENPDAAEWWSTMYDLINPSEFLAGMAGHRFARESFESRNYTWWQSFMQKLGQWLRAIIDTLRRLFGASPSMDQIYREILAGKRVTNPQSGVEYEGGRHGQLEGEPIENAGVDPADLEFETSKAEELADKEGWIKTEVLGRKDYVRGRDVLTKAERAAGADYAKKVFDRANLQVTQQPNGLWRLTDPGMESEIEGRKLLDILSKEIAIQNQPGSVTGYLGNLLNSVVVNMTQDDISAFSPELKRDLYSVAQGERSQRGLLLGALAGFGKTVDYIARNVDVVLSKVYSDRFGGDEIRRVLGKIMTEFRGMFTDDEIKQALAGHPAFDQTISKLIAMNMRDEGGRVYRRAQSMLKPKNAKKLARLESDARVTEAVNQILQQLKVQGIEPPPNPNKPLAPLHRLLMLVHPETAKKIDAAIGNAIADAEHNAGIKAALKAAQTDEEREELLIGFGAGEEPDEDMVEAGLAMPEYAHWKALRDNLLGYSPTTIKVVQSLIKADFKGVRYGKKPTAKPADTRIDLKVLATQPDDEVRRVINAYAQNLDNAMTMEEATEDTRLRILDRVHLEVNAQLERIRKQMRDEQLANPVQKGVALTPEQRIAQLINAGIFADDRLDIPAMVDRLAGKSSLQKLAPNIGKLVSQVFSTPFYRQSELAEHFAQVLSAQLSITPEQEETAKKVFQAAFEKKLNQARESAFKKAMASLDPQERKVLRAGKGLWKKIEEAVNSGIFDTGIVLQTVAASHGWNIPSEAEITRMKAWAAEIQRLNELSAAEKATIGDSPHAAENALRDKRAATLEKRIALKKKVEATWAKMTHPLGFKSQEGRQNLAMAVNEFTSANLLFKIGFPFRLAQDILVQGAIHTPTRAIGAAIARYQTDLSAGRPTTLWNEVTSALRDAYRVRLAATKANLVTVKQSLAGKGDARNIDRLMSRIAVFERMEAKAEALAQEGKTVQSAALRLLHLISFSYRVAQTLDTFQGLPAEYQEMRQQVETALRENGMTKAEAMVNAENVIGDMRAEWALAIARVNEIFQANGLEGTPNDLKAAAWQVVKSRQYSRMKLLGLPADDFEEINRVIRSTVAWAEREDGGLGGIFGTVMRATTNAAAKLGLPFPLARFSNAIATGINRTLTFTPLGFFPQAFGESPWFKTAEDRTQRKVEAALGSTFGLLFASLVLAGVIKVWLKPPQDKTARDLWEKEGHRANTMEIILPDGSFIPISLLIGPGRYVGPYVAAAGALKDATERHEAAQKALEAEAAKKGVAPGNVRPLTVADYMGVAGWAAYETVVGGRTAAGLVSSFTDQNTVNVNKAVSGFISPLVPGLPGLQEITRMAGIALDAKQATVLDFMLPLPTSAARKINVLGDNVGTESALQRITQILTGGSYPLPIQPGDAHAEAGYQALYDTGFRPATINPGKGYAIDGQMRPMTATELQKYTELRGEYLKDALANLPDPTDRKAVQAAYKDANTRALAAVGVDTAPAAQSSGASRATSVTGIPATVASGIPGRRPTLGRRGHSRARGRISTRGMRRGPSLRAGRRLTFRTGRATRGRSVRTSRRRL